MKLKNKIISICIVVVMIICLIEPFSDIFKVPAVAASARSYEIATGNEGTTTNPFVVVEIVPDESMGRLRYFFDNSDIEDTQKIDYSKFKTDDDIKKLKTLGLVSETDTTALKYKENHQYKEKLDKDDKESEWKKIEGLNEDFKEDGYYEYVGNNKGQYSIESHDEGYVYNPSGGDYIQNVDYFVWGDTSKYDYEVEMQYNEKGNYNIHNVSYVSGNGYYDKVTYLAYNKDSEIIVKFRYNPGSTKAIDRYNIKSAEKNDNGMYIKTTDSENNEVYTFSEDIKTGEDRYDVIFEYNKTGSYIVGKQEQKELTETKFNMCRYSVPDRYIYVNGRTGDYNVDFVKAAEGDTANYSVVKYSFKKGLGNASASLKSGEEYVKVGSGEKGYYNIQTEYVFKYMGDNKGDFVWHQNDSWPSNYKVPSYPTGGDFDKGKQIWMRQQVVYKNIYEKKSFAIASNNLFKKNVLGITDADELKQYDIDFYTLTPEAINSNITTTTSGENNILESADFIYVSDYNETNVFSQVFAEYNISTLAKANSSEKYSATNDLTYNAARCLMEQVATKRKVPLVLDYSKDGYEMATSTSKTSGTTTKIYQLPIYTAIYGSARFYNYFMNDCNGTLTTALDADGNYCGKESGEKNKLYDQLFIPKGVAGTDDLRLQNTLGIKVGSLVINNSDNKFEYTKSVIENVYFNIKGNNILSTNFIKDMYSSYADRGEAFKDVLEKESELSPANIFKYLVNYAKNNKSVDKESLTVLDIEPCCDYTTSSDFQLKNNNYTKVFEGKSAFKVSYKKNGSSNIVDNMKYIYLRSLMSNFYGSIDIVEETSSEFVGDIEDFNTTYDLIYFGLNTGNMNTNSSGKTQYNDSRMDGLIYTHVGDRVLGGFQLSGLLDKKTTYSVKKSKKYVNVYSALGAYDEYTGHRTDGFDIKSNILDSARVMTTESYRLSGNDITESIVKRLKEYVDAGYAVLAENELYNCNTDIIDKTSKIYEFISDYKSKNNVVNIAYWSNQTIMNQLKEAISKEKISISLKSKPAEYKKTDAGVVTYNNNGISTESGGSIISYTFSINDADGDSSSTYIAKLFIDVNADGDFDTSETIRTMKGLRKDTEYTLEKTLTKDYTGVIPWKIAVTKSEGNGIYRAEEKGYTCIKCPSVDKTVLKILQIATDTTSSNSKLGNYGSTWVASKFDMESQYYNTSSLFSKYASNLDDFKFVVDTITVTDFVKMYVSQDKDYICDDTAPEYRDGITQTDIDKNNGHTMKTNNYDMLVVGFADCYVDFYCADVNSDDAKERAVKNIQTFIDKGRGVMFSHDTTSFINLDFTNTASNKINSTGYWPFGSVTNWGYSINRYLRARLGTDRYGITDKDNTLGQTYDTATKPNGENYIEQQGYAYCSFGKSLFDGDINTSYTNTWFKNFDKNKNTGVTPQYYSSGDEKKLNKYGATDNKNAFFYGNNQETTTVTMVNEGQITNYPYKLGKTITVSKTHGPYYQLNLEQEGAVVWYCLAPTGSSASSAIYAESPNDMRNFYYIYSVGNIMYTGAGHDNFASTDDEVKLFINTIVAAYVSEKEEGAIKIENSAGQVKDENGTTDVIYGYFDYEDEGKTLIDESLIDVVFSVDDTNLSSDEMTFEVQKVTETADGKFTTSEIDPSTIKLYDEYDNVETQSGGKYTINKAALYTLGINTDHYMDNNDYCIIRLSADSNDGSKKVEANVKIVRRSVFEMK